MLAAWLGWLAVALGTPALPGVIDVALPRQSELSAVSSDPVELERLAARLGGKRVLDLWSESASRGHSKPASVLMRSLGLYSLQHPERACQLLPVFLDTALPLLRGGRLDDAMTKSVADTLQRMGEGIGQAHWESDFVGPPQSADLTPEVSEVARRLLAVAMDAASGGAGPVREAALLALSALPVGAWTGLAAPLAKLAQSSDAPSVQRAAMSALAVLGQHERSPLLSEIALNSSDPSIASLAAAEVCLLASPSSRRAGPAGPSSSISPALAARVRALAAQDFSLPHRQRLGECLRLLGTPQDRLLWLAIQNAAKRPRR